MHACLSQRQTRMVHISWVRGAYTLLQAARWGIKLGTGTRYQVLGISVQDKQPSAISFQERKLSVIGYQCSVLASLSFIVFSTLDCRLSFQPNEPHELHELLPRGILFLWGNELYENSVRHSWGVLEAMLRFLRDKLEKAESEESAHGEKASHKQVSGTRYQILGKEVFSYHCSVRASFSLCELDLHNQ